MYKAGQGMPSRIGAVIVGVIVALYASFSWYRWHPFVGDISGGGLAAIDTIIAAVLLFGGVGTFIWLAFKRPSSADYLIDMDDELRKVVWPAVMPLFDPKTEAWGSTYVVIVCAIIFTLFIWIADTILNFLVNTVLFQYLLFT